LGTITPDDEATIAVYSPAIVVRVEVLANGETPLFNVERNGSVSVTIGQQSFYRSSDITVRITEICAPCKYTGGEFVYYSQNSVSPHFEVFVLSVGIYATTILLAFGNWLVVNRRLRVRRWWLVLAAIPVGLFFYGYYLWAFRDTGYIALWVGALAAALAVPSFLLAVERRVPQTGVDPVAIAKRHVRASLRGSLRFQGWTSQWSQDGTYADVRGLVIDGRLNSHMVKIRVTKDREIVAYVLE
jgi:hypothetical protein